MGERAFVPGILDDDERDAVIARFGVPLGQVVRDHVISHALAAIATLGTDSVVFLGGTALSRTLLPDLRLSEDIDLIALGDRSKIGAAIQKAIERQFLRSFGRPTFTPHPSWLNFPGEQGHVRYGEGVFVGYRYYTSGNTPVRYSFGHGLSYTDFTTETVAVRLVGDAAVEVDVTVTNTGDRVGKHVVQVYVAGGDAPVRRPVRELRAFAKVALQAGETKSVTLRLDRRAFAYWDVELKRWIVAPGHYRIQIGADAATVLREASITLTGDSIARELTLESSVGDWFGHPVVGPLLMQGMTAGMTEEQVQQAAENPDQLKMVESMPMQQFLAFTQGAIPPESLEQMMRLSQSSATHS